ncbi:MAG: hypothetical protein KDD40_07005, partial [Bdellovibrionales bacterium]|nr:hypothetical protein [Bdellovibrionales bacterium]
VGVPKKQKQLKAEAEGKNAKLLEDTLDLLLYNEMGANAFDVNLGQDLTSLRYQLNDNLNNDYKMGSSEIILVSDVFARLCLFEELQEKSRNNKKTVTKYWTESRNISDRFLAKGEELISCPFEYNGSKEVIESSILNTGQFLYHSQVSAAMQIKSLKVKQDIEIGPEPQRLVTLAEGEECPEQQKSPYGDCENKNYEQELKEHSEKPRFKYVSKEISPIKSLTSSGTVSIVGNDVEDQRTPGKREAKYDGVIKIVYTENGAEKKATIRQVLRRRVTRVKASESRIDDFGRELRVYFVESDAGTSIVEMDTHYNGRKDNSETIKQNGKLVSKDGKSIN